MAECGVGARRKCDEAISQGRVSVNGVLQTRLGVQINEKRDIVLLDGRRLRPVQRFEYIILNKPKGYVTTAADEKARKTVLDLVKTKTRVFPVGRLDIHTTGLLLLTNDGELAYKLTHPKFGVAKIYGVTLDADLNESDRKKLQAGIALEEGKTAHCRIEFLNLDNRRVVHMTLHQGWKHQVRRMFESCGYQVLKLKRVGLGTLTLRGLRMGEWRKLTHLEVTRLKSLLNGEHEN
jgi:23S rRNA pseudouridine2605 synthase